VIQATRRADTASPPFGRLSRRREPPDVICNAHEQRMWSLWNGPHRLEFNIARIMSRGAAAFFGMWVHHSDRCSSLRSLGSPRRGHSRNRFRKPQTFSRPFSDRGAGSGAVAGTVP
jgi:hypothetical protein